MKQHREKLQSGAKRQNWIICDGLELFAGTWKICRNVSRPKANNLVLVTVFWYALWLNHVSV